MPADRTLIYWDTCVFLSYLEATAGRVEALSAILADCRSTSGSTKIVTSAWTLAEVSYLKVVEQDGDASAAGDSREISSAGAAVIDRMWSDSAILVPVDLTPHIARMARDLSISARATGRRLLPKDAVHLATASYASAAAFHTYDTRLTGYASEIGISIGKPDLMYVQHAGIPGRQGELHL